MPVQKSLETYWRRHVFQAIHFNIKHLFIPLIVYLFIYLFIHLFYSIFLQSFIYSTFATSFANWIRLEQLFYSFESFSHLPQLMVFYWSLSDSKSPQVSMTILSILADSNNDLVKMASTRPLISKSSTPSTNFLVTVPSSPITIGITVTFMFHCFSIL